MEYLDNILFVIVLAAGIGYFTLNIRKVIRNIKLGKAIDRTDQQPLRIERLVKVALGQSKMVARPIAGFFHIIIYLGFIIINIEVLEIIADGIFGTHRIFGEPLGVFYNFLIATFEVLAALVLVSVVVFWFRRNINTLPRFKKPEMEGWAKQDGNMILYIETVLMFLFLTMNAADFYSHDGTMPGSFPISSNLFFFFEGMDVSTLHVIERTAWWLHITGILLFLNYLYWSKHLHIMLAFPNVYFSNLKPKGEFTNLASVTNEVKLMMDPNADPYANVEVDLNATPDRFGAKDIFDLNQVQLLNAYTCTECGRCTSECPANQTGKKLSPRKIMMDTRDRLEAVGKNIDLNGGTFKDDGKSLLNDHITPEELWACTSCNACTQACPVNIDPLSIIVDLRRYLVMEESAAPIELNNMMSNVENNAAPWPFAQADRFNWATEK